MISQIKKLYLLLVILPGFAWGEVQVTDIEFAALPGEQFEIKLLFSEKPPQPKAYEISNPARLILDFPGVGSRLAEKKYTPKIEIPKAVTAKRDRSKSNSDPAIEPQTPKAQAASNHIGRPSIRAR